MRSKFCFSYPFFIIIVEKHALFEYNRIGIRVREINLPHFKKEGGRKLMCEAFERYLQQKSIEATVVDGISFGVTKEIIIKRLCEKYNLTKLVAEQVYDKYAPTATCA